MNESIAVPRLPDPSLSTDTGLRSAQGIRWLLFAGALVAAVSVFHLVGSVWSTIPVPIQFLVLNAGALGLFALGNLTRERLRLPYAGTALLALFAVLIPILTWGADRLELFRFPLGWPAFALGALALLAAARRMLRAVIGYEGWLYPAALGVLMCAPHLLLHLTGAGGPAVVAATAFGLGATFYLGSRHVNRFLFHRDRRDGCDRPLSFLPFLMLGGLYALDVAMLGWQRVELALPLAILGAVLIATGEEYYRALTESLDAPPERWPRRSVALLALGFGALLAALPLAALDVDSTLALLTSTTVAVCLLRWALRYGSIWAHLTGLLTALVAYHLAGEVIPRSLTSLAYRFFDLVGARGIAEVGWAELPFAIGLLGLGVVLERRDTPARLRTCHLVASFVFLALLTLPITSDPHGAVVLVIATLAASFAALVLSCRVELALAVQASLGFLATVLACTANGAEQLANPLSAMALGVVFLAQLAAGRRLEAALERLTGAAPAVVRAMLILPASLAAAWVAFAGVSGLWALDPAGTASLALAAALTIAIGLRIGDAGVVSTGLYALVAWFPAQVLAQISFESLAQTAIAALAAAGIALLGLATAAPAAPGRWLFRRGELREEDLDALTRSSPRLALRLWAAAVVLAFLALSGSVAGAAIGAALGWAVLRLHDAEETREADLVVVAEAWLGLALLQTLSAGWHDPRQPALQLLLVGLGIGHYTLARRFRQPAVSAVLGTVGLGLAMIVGLLAVFSADGFAPAWGLLPAVLASLFLLVVATIDERRIVPGSAAAALLGFSLLRLLMLAEPRIELYFLAPGLALLVLARVLRRELGAVWNRHVATAGATCLYATPIVALARADAAAWGWLAVLGVLAVGFGAASFALRSRWLLVVSTSALLTDLTFFTFRIVDREPLVLWAGGLAFGLGVMCLAAVLERRREDLLQRLRLFAGELHAWH